MIVNYTGCKNSDEDSLLQHDYFSQFVLLLFPSCRQYHLHLFTKEMCHRRYYHFCPLMLKKRKISLIENNMSALQISARFLPFHNE